MTSAAVAVTLSASRRRAQKRSAIAFGLVAPALHLHDGRQRSSSDPEGLQIAAVFIAAIVVVSLISRRWRSTELRAASGRARRRGAALPRRGGGDGELRIIANHPDDRTPREYLLKEREEREASNIPPGDAGPLPGGHRARRLGVRAGDPGAGARRSAGTGCCARSGAGGPERDRGVAALHPRPRPAAARTPISAGRRATRSSTWRASSSSARRHRAGDARGAAAGRAGPGAAPGDPRGVARRPAIHEGRSGARA